MPKRAGGLREWSAPALLLFATLLFCAALILWAESGPKAQPTPSAVASTATSWAQEAQILRPRETLAGAAAASIEPSTPLLPDEGKRRIDAAFKLGESNDPRALHPLCGCLSDDVETESLRIACATALGRLRRAGTVACLAKHLDHWSPTIRDHVRKTLASFEEEFPKAEKELVRKVKMLEDRAEVEGEIGERAAWLKIREELVAVRWQLTDLQREFESIPEVADGGH